MWPLIDMILFVYLLGLDNIDYSRYPDEELQKKWIAMYLEEKAKLKGMKIQPS